MRLSGVLFDKDGTLVSFEKTWGPTIHATITALAKGDPQKLAAQAEALHFSIADQTFLPTSPVIAGSTNQMGLAWAGALGRTDFFALKAEIEALVAVETLRALTPIGAPAETLAELKGAGYKIGVATNDAEAGARAQLAALGLAEFVDFVAGYDSGHGSKPQPGMVNAFAETVGAPTAEIAMVGDTRHDLEAARAAGALAIAVLSGPAGRDELAPLADHVLADISTLPALLEALQRGEG